MTRYLITCALPYANGALHFGHLAGACLPADVSARHRRFTGHEVLFLSGSDEFGVAITLSAELEGRTPKQQADVYHEKNRSLFERLNFSFDHFTRTTSEAHPALVERFFRDLRANKLVEQRETEQLYCEDEQRYLSDRYVSGICPACAFEAARGDECPRCGASYEAIELRSPVSRITGSPLVRRPTRHWYLLLDRLKDRLAQWLAQKNWKPNVMHFAAAYIRDLKPRSITRDSSWGVPVPRDLGEFNAEESAKVFYVWFDAPIGYLTAAQEWARKRGNPEDWKRFWCEGETRLVQFLGKDNIPFHAAIFPGMIMGQKLPYKLVDDLVANEFYHLEGRKLSKTEGWTVDLGAFLANFTPDQLRYYLAATAPENGDSEFTWTDFQERCNAELVGKLGNLVHRVLSFAATHLGGSVPEPTWTERDRAALSRAQHLLDQIDTAYGLYRLRRASQLILELAQWGNVYFDANKPWALAKSGQSAPLNTAIYCCAEVIRLIAIAAYPLMPASAQEIWRQLGCEGKIEAKSWRQRVNEPIVSGQVLAKPQLLFRKIEDSEVQRERENLRAATTPARTAQEPATKGEVAPLKSQVDLQAFQALDLRVGQIRSAKRVEKASKLLELQVDLGGEVRPVVAGLAKRITPEELVGRKAIFVANLAPANLFGVESRGMILAGQTGDFIHIPDPGDLPNGTRIA